jgi:hypothetical protein
LAASATLASALHLIDIALFSRGYGLLRLTLKRWARYSGAIEIEIHFQNGGRGLRYVAGIHHHIARGG